jgi:hypothetical protein
VKFFAVHLDDLESEAFIESTDQQVATWLHLHGLLARLANGPTLIGAGSMAAKFWMRKGIDETVLRAPCKLWSWEGEDLTVTPYDSQGEELFLKKKAGGAAGAKKRWNNPKNGNPDRTPINSPNGTPNASHLVLSNLILSDQTLPQTTKGKAHSQEGVQFAQWFKSSLPETVKLKANWQESFAKTFDDLVRLDGRSPDEIRQVCKWGRTDPFWQSNFMSPAKLRERNPSGIKYFDVFAEKSKPSQPTPKQTPTINMGGRIETVEII